MKKLIIIVMMSVLSLAVFAQTETTRTIHGAVIDKNGNPLPGAVVSAEGGADTSIAESDGTFSMEVPVRIKNVSASYGGYVKRTLKTNFDKEMIFRMRKPAPTPGGYFINLVGGYGINVHDPGDYNNMYIGLKGGRLANWGWYAEIGYDALGKGVQIIGGAIRRIYGPAFFYLGAGYGKTTYGGSYLYTDEETGKGIYSIERKNALALDGAFAFMCGKHINISVGVTYTYDDMYHGTVFPKLSIGYVF